MEQQVEIMAIAGSLREGSFNRALIRTAIELAPENLDIEHFLLDDLPFFNQDLEKDGDPQSVRRYKKTIRDSDGLLIATPEYQYSVTGVLKNAIDWGSRPPRDAPLHGKPVAMMGASPGMIGTARSHMHLRQILMYNEMKIIARPEVLVARARDKFDESGKLTDDVARSLIEQLLEKLMNVAKANRS